MRFSYSVCYAALMVRLASSKQGLHHAQTHNLRTFVGHAFVRPTKMLHEYFKVGANTIAWIILA